MALSIINKWDIAIGDVSTAFLHAPVSEPSYVVPPPMYYAEDKEPTYWLLKKALYGLKNAPKSWTEHITMVLKEMGYVRMVAEESTYALKQDNIAKIGNRHLRRRYFDICS